MCLHVLRSWRPLQSPNTPNFNIINELTKVLFLLELEKFYFLKVIHRFIFKCNHVHVLLALDALFTLQ
jgi:hypothetical protein